MTHLMIAYEEVTEQHRDLMVRQAQAVIDGNRAAYLENNALIACVLTTRSRILDQMDANQLRRTYPHTRKPRRHLRSV